jgi:nicotinamide riboside transporter PnuC
MSGANITNLVIGVAMLVLFVSRQLATRRLRESYRLLIILAAIGVVQFATFLNGYPHHDGAIAAAVAGSLVLAAVLGAARAPTVRVWRQDGQLLRKRTWLTARQEAADRVPASAP